VTIDDLLDRGLAASDVDTFTLTLDRALQGLPDTAHGGTVLAVFDRVGGLGGPREIVGTYRRRVPPGVPLVLRRQRQAGATSFVVADDRTTFVEGRVVSGNGPDPGPAPTLEGGGRPLPVSRSCFACGVDNAVGLRVRLRFDDAAVRADWAPPPHVTTAGGTVSWAAITTLLDEAAFWLGALATGESGMTTELRVRLDRPAPSGVGLVVSGRRAEVRPRADGRYRDTTVAVHDADGAPVASGDITFVAVRGAARRLVAWLGSTNPPDALREVFPAYA
jgi:acyl-coenzyme A thioesterase PaaI-like protein